MGARDSIPPVDVPESNRLRRSPTRVRFVARQRINEGNVATLIEHSVMDRLAGAVGGQPPDRFHFDQTPIAEWARLLPRECLLRERESSPTV